MGIEDEFADAELGDKRLSRRLITIALQFEGQADASYPAAAGSDAALEATYRFLSNAAVSPEAILAPHFAATAARARGKAIVVAHDSTEFLFRRPEMGKLGEGRIGFLGHFALAVTSDDTRAPLGVVGLETIVRGPARPRAHKVARLRHLEPENEELRWWRVVEQAERSLKPRTAIHVMDREADSFELFARMLDSRCRFVIRTHYNRVTVPEGIDHVTRRASSKMPKMNAVLSDAPGMITVEIPVSARKAVNRNRATAARDARIARVEYAACQVTLARPTWTRIEGPPTLSVNVVQVREPNPPTDCDPIEWRLITSEPIDTPEQVTAIIDAYRARWRIEEYFRALKQGCAYEKRQLENQRAIMNALAVFVPIAWELLALRSAGRTRPDAPALSVLNPLKLRLLERHPNIRLVPGSSAREAMLAVAKLGGHIKNNGDPGWIVLGRGFDKLLTLEQGALIARQRSDQS